MIMISDKHLCCGCSACVQRCPKHCISLREDEEGFLYPVVNKQNCINCNLCEKVCPVINKFDSKFPLKVYAVVNRNEKDRLNSSSGGVFIALAQKVIDEGGIVFGCRFDRNWEVYHCKTETKSGILPLMRSKYMQSRIENTYREAEHFLMNGRKVLFVGTSCQIAGLKRYLRKPYENLVAVDFICHGVPSPGVWRKYLHDVLNKFSISKSSIVDINFRAKKGFGWKKFGFVIHGNFLEKNSSNYYFVSDIAVENSYMKGFLSNIYLRPSCYQCPAKGGRSSSDLTIADYWNIDKVIPNCYDDDKGISLVFVNTIIGENYLKNLNFSLITAPFAETIENNQSYNKSVVEPQRRKYFFTNLIKYDNFEIALSKYNLPTFKQRIKYLIKSALFIKK